VRITFQLFFFFFFFSFFFTRRSPFVFAVDTSEPRKEVTQRKFNEYGARKQQIEQRIQELQAGGVSVFAIFHTCEKKKKKKNSNQHRCSQPASPALPHMRQSTSELSNALPQPDDTAPPAARSLPPKPLPSAPNNANGPASFSGSASMPPPPVSGTMAFGSSSDGLPVETYAEGSATGVIRPPGPSASIGIGNTQTPQAYNADNAYKVLVLWVTDAPVHARLQQLRDAGHDVLMTQTFAEGMKVLRRNTNITHIANNMHRAGGKLAATTELISLVNKYDDTLPIILTTFEDDKKKGKKRGGISDADLATCMQMGAKCHVHSMEEFLAALKELAVPAKKSANLGPPPANPQARNWGKSVYNTNGLEFFVGEKIGGGNFGVIYDCKDVFGQDYVCKILKTNRPEEEVQADWAKETQFLFSLNHPNIVQLYDAFCFNNLYHMILERCTGSMRDYVERHGPLPGADVVSVGGMILAGLHHIHCRNIIHRDLHVDNILYAPPRTAAQKLCIKISDFGISKLLRPTENAAVTFIGRDYDYCFREDDHQILTSRGFMFLDEVEAAVVRDRHTGRVVDWRGLQVANYEPRTRALVYEQPRALIVNRTDDTLLEFAEDGDAASGVALAVTREHNMYAAVDSGDFVKMSAAELAQCVKQGRKVRFQLGAAAGVQRAATCDRAVGAKRALADAHEQSVPPVPLAGETPFLELCGVWLADGAAVDGRCVEWSVACGAFVRERVDALGWACEPSDAAGRVRVCEPAAVRAFAHVDAEWALASLSAHGSQCVLRGLSAATSPDNAATVVVRSAAMRDFVLRLCVHAGFAAFVEPTSSAFIVHFAESRDGERAPRNVSVNEVAFVGRTWCFDMRDGFVVVRRAERKRVGNEWLVSNVSAASVSGNCPELVTKGHTTKRSDIYQLGLVLYHIYTGQHALSANDGNNVVQIVTSGLARSRAEQLNTKLGDVIAIMLRRAPEYRYKDCVETAAHLFAILDS
jgi:hypothetical protein